MVPSVPLLLERKVQSKLAFPFKYVVKSLNAANPNPYLDDLARCRFSLS